MTRLVTHTTSENFDWEYSVGTVLPSLEALTLIAEDCHGPTSLDWAPNGGAEILCWRTSTCNRCQVGLAALCAVTVQGGSLPRRLARADNCLKELFCTTARTLPALSLTHTYPGKQQPHLHVVPWPLEAA